MILSLICTPPKGIQHIFNVYVDGVVGSVIMVHKTDTAWRILYGVHPGEHHDDCD